MGASVSLYEIFEQKNFMLGEISTKNSSKGEENRMEPPILLRGTIFGSWEAITP